jgi:hypothetical protein
VWSGKARLPKKFDVATQFRSSLNTRETLVCTKWGIDAFCTSFTATGLFMCRHNSYICLFLYLRLAAVSVWMVYTVCSPIRYCFGLYYGLQKKCPDRTTHIVCICLKLAFELAVTLVLVGNRVRISAELPNEDFYFASLIRVFRGSHFSQPFRACSSSEFIMNYILYMSVWQDWQRGELAYPRTTQYRIT